MFSAPATAMGGVLLLQTAVERLSWGRKETELTLVHADLLRLCILARAYRTAAPYVEREYLSLMDASTGSEALLSFYYYGGIVMAALRRYRRAMACFQAVMCAPLPALSAIAVEAFKKYSLVSLIEQGAVATTIPRMSQSHTMRHIKMRCFAYVELANACATFDPEVVGKFVAENKQAWQKDGNWGLVKRVSAALTKHNVTRLTKTYMTLSLKDIAEAARLASPQQAAAVISAMLDEGRIHATVSHDGMVTFHEDPESYDTTAMVQRLDRQIRSVMALAGKLKEADQEIATSLQFIRKTIRRGPKGGGAGAGPAGMGGDITMGDDVNDYI
jgi:COP9 signalosome complex subunit 3